MTTTKYDIENVDDEPVVKTVDVARPVFIRLRAWLSDYDYYYDVRVTAIDVIESTPAGLVTSVSLRNGQVLRVDADRMLASELLSIIDGAYR